MTTTWSKKQGEKTRNLIKQLGGAKRIHEELTEYKERVERMESLRPKLMKKYPDKWVAMADGDIVAVADTLDDILVELDNRGVRRAEAVVEFLNTHPRNMIL